MDAHIRELRSENPTAVELPVSFSRQTTLQGLTGYINAGGRGTRLNPIFAPDPKTGVSKALLQVGQPPLALIEHHINKLATVGLPVIVAGVGDHHNVALHVRKRYAQNPNVHILEADAELGNGGDLVVAARSHKRLFAGQVLIANVDTILDINEVSLAKQHYATGAHITIALTKNRGVPNEDAYYVGHDALVIHCAETTREPPSKDVDNLTSYRASSTGTLIVDSELLRNMDWSPENGPLSLYRDIMGFALGKSGVYAYNNGHRLFIDVGTVNTWNAVQQQPDMIQPTLAYGTKQQRRE